MPDNDRWRSNPDRYRYRDDRRPDEADWGYPRGRREDYRGGGFGGADRESWYAARNGDYRPESDRDYGGRPYCERERREDYRGDFRGRSATMATRPATAWAARRSTGARSKETAA